MQVIIKQAKIIDPSSPHHLTVKDILISNDRITAIESNIEATDALEVSEPGLCISPGWIDIFAHFCDPGYEFRETLETGARAAAAGGFTKVMVLPNTRPVVDSKSQVEYIVQKSHSLPIQIIPIGAITKNAEGAALAEMYDMRNSGAVAFSDGLNPLQSAGIMVKALQYVKAFDGVIMQIPDDKTLAQHGLMNEGIVSTRLGLPGKPALAEEVIVARDIELARYTCSKVHFTGVSSPKSIEYIRQAKQDGLAVTCSVTPYHLFFCDEDLEQYDTNLKVNPPLRTRADRDLLRQAVSEGLVDCIATHHLPQEYDSKSLEFEYAKNGMIGLETAYAALRTAMPEVSEESWVAMLSTNPSAIFNLPNYSISKGENATLTLFNPETVSTYTEKQLFSASKNTPFIGKELKGRVKGIFSKGQVILNN